MTQPRYAEVLSWVEQRDPRPQVFEAVVKDWEYTLEIRPLE